MSENVSTFNRCWAKVILETLVRSGVQHICIAPGSRSTPLTLEAVRLQEMRRAECHSHFDERGLGFFALGLAKATHTPVAVIVTSGTAAANLYPAIIEARQTGVNLVILTADRPPELLECGANQAILQQNMFASYPVSQVNLPRPSEDFTPQWLIATIEQACYQQTLTAGVIHINVPFPEPLYNAKNEDVDKHFWLKPIQRWLIQNHKWIHHETEQNDVLMHENWDYWRAKRGVIVVGALPLEQSMGISQWAETMGWILITDIQSGVQPSLPHADIWLANETVRQRLLQADIVLQLGSRFVSKRVNQFLFDYQGEFWVVDESIRQVDPHHHSQTRFRAKIHHWLRVHPPLRQKPWTLEPLALSNFCAGFIEQQVGTGLNEASLAHHLHKVLPNNALVFLGNSLFVRLVDAFGKVPDTYPIYTNRGASGIDGLLATAAGLEVGANRPLVGFIGDISALYDLNSLACLKKCNLPTVIFIINNSGGSIFDMLPVDESVKNEFYRMSHNLEFSAAAAMFDIKYARPFTWADLNSVLRVAYTRKEATIIEIKTGTHDGSELYKMLIDKISQAVLGAN